MKTIKRVIAVIAIIILALVVGYLIYTGGRLADVQSDTLTILGGAI
jgi:hypothetical protein